MALIESPEKWIVKMFTMNERETGGQGTAFFPDGSLIDNPVVQPGEPVYGHFKAHKNEYFFTKHMLVIAGKEVTVIPYAAINKTNGYLRSGHTSINIETKNGIKHKLKVAELPYRIQQLLYQLIEHHGSLSTAPNFKGPKKLNALGNATLPAEILKQLKADADTCIKAFDIGGDWEIYFHGDLKEMFIYPDQSGLLIIELRSNGEKIVVFNSGTDGYNGVSETKAGTVNKVKPELQKLDIPIEKLVAVFRYSVSGDEYPDLKAELDLKHKSEMNDLYGAIEIYIITNNKLVAISEYETQ